MEENNVNQEEQDTATRREFLFRTGVFYRERRDTLESEASSLEFSDTEEASFLNYASSSRDDEEQQIDEREEPQTQEASENSWERDSITPVQRVTTLERVLSDAIIHHASLDELKVILEAGSSVINPTVKRPNPLHYSVWQRYPEAAELVLSHGTFCH